MVGDAALSSDPSRPVPPLRMLTTVIGWVVCFSAGVALQLRLRDPQKASHIVFLIVLWVISPLVIVYAYTTVSLAPEMLAAFAVAVAASWIMLGIGALWSRLAGRDTRERGVMTLATSMGNTGNVGYPLATLAFGGPGLALAVVYSEFQYVIPLEAVIYGLGRHYAGPASRGAPAPGVGRLLRSWFLNPPMLAAAVAVVVRLVGVDITEYVTPWGPALGIATGMLGFAQLGLAMPLKWVVHDRARLWRAGVTLVLRCIAAPLVLYAIGLICGVHIPGVFLLIAAMPVGFNTMILSAVFDLDGELARLLIAVSTPLVIAAVYVWQAFC